MLSQTTVFQVISSVITCPDPTNIENGVRIPEFGPYECTDQVTYMCKHGYQLQGNATVICGHDGRFSSTAAQCEEPSECSIVTPSCVIKYFQQKKLYISTLSIFHLKYIEVCEPTMQLKFQNDV